MNKYLGYCLLKRNAIEYKVHLYFDGENFTYKVKSSNWIMSPPHLFKHIFAKEIESFEYVKSKPLLEAPLLIPFFSYPTEEGISFVKEGSELKMKEALEQINKVAGGFLDKKELEEALASEVTFNKAKRTFEINPVSETVNKNKVAEDILNSGDVVFADFKNGKNKNKNKDKE